MFSSKPPPLHIQYDSELSLMRTGWTRPANAGQLRPSALHLSGAARHHRVQHHLLDLNLLEDISVFDQLWLSAHWLPGAQDLPVQRVVVLLGENRLHNKMAVDSLIAHGQEFCRFDIQFFSEPQPALGWLTNDSPRVPALLADWKATLASAA